MNAAMGTLTSSLYEKLDRREYLCREYHHSIFIDVVVPFLKKEKKKNKSKSVLINKSKMSFLIISTAEPISIPVTLKHKVNQNCKPLNIIT